MTKNQALDWLAWGVLGIVVLAIILIDWRVAAATALQAAIICACIRVLIRARQ